MEQLFSPVLSCPISMINHFTSSAPELPTPPATKWRVCRTRAESSQLHEHDLHMLVEAFDALEDALTGIKVMANRLNYHTQRTPRLRCVCILRQGRGAAGVDRYA